jgi:transposase
MLTVYRFKLYPNEEQEETFSKYFSYNRVAWNKALELREIHYRSTTILFVGYIWRA